MIRLLIQSEDRSLQTMLALPLGEDYQVKVEPSPSLVRRALSEEEADVLIVDVDSNGRLDQALTHIAEVRGSRVPVVAMTDDDRPSTAMSLVQHGVYDYFRKPPHILELKLVVRRAHEHAQLRRKLEATAAQLRDLTTCDNLIGSSGRMRVVYDLIRRVANLNTFVLVHGESGTGKELIAAAIHNLSERSKGPFVGVSCGAIPETLIEAELFGHEKGAYTGAATAREGYFEKAAGGTVFLDEIGELSLSTQVKLLRVLQQREFCRLGSNRPVPLEARVVFATHRNLEQMVEEGTFRQDLYFRINILKIEAPPLRERVEDIPELAEHFLRRHTPPGREAPGILTSAMDVLLAYQWPGNVRELENVMQRAAILNEGYSISLADLPEPMRTAAAVAEQAARSQELLDGLSFEEQLREYKLRLVSKALSECNGNKTLAAQKLCITRAYLHRLLRQQGETAAEAAAVEP